MQTIEQQKGQGNGYRVLFDPVPVTATKLRRLTLSQLTFLHALATVSSSVGLAAMGSEASAALYLKGWLRPFRPMGDRERWRLAITLSGEQLHLIEELIGQKSR